MNKLPPLIPDDPTRVVTQTEPTPGAPGDQLKPTAKAATTSAASAAAQTPTDRTQARKARKTLTQAAPASPDVGLEWSGTTDVTTVRVLIEILRLLRGRARALGLPIGMIVTAGLVDALTAIDEDLIERVDATQTRYGQARRRAHRAA